MRWIWIDTFVEFEAGRRAATIKNVSLAEDYLHDHMVGYPIMPNSLVVEGMAQTGGLLVSERYGFGELVVLGKLAKVKFYSCVRTGETLTYRVRVATIRDDGAAVSGTAHVGDRLHAKALLFFARLGDANESLQGQQLFRPSDLRHWLSLVGIFEVGVHQDGTRMKEQDYPLEECSAGAS